MTNKYSGYTSATGGYKMRHGKGGKGGKFGKSGGGQSGLSSRLLHSPMAPKMVPKGGGKGLHGKVKEG